MQRLVLQAVVYVRSVVMRSGAGGVIALAVAGVGLLWMLRGRRRDGDRGGRGDGSSGGLQGGSRRGRRLQGMRREIRGVGLGGMRGVRKVTVGMEGGGDGTKSLGFVKEDGKLRLKDGVAGCLGKLGKMGEVYVVVRVGSDEEEGDVTRCLDREMVFGRGVSKDRVVFCETVIGRVSIARQIESQLHVDCSTEVVAGLQRFIKYVTLIGRGNLAGPVKGTNVSKYETYAAYLERGLNE